MRELLASKKFIAAALSAGFAFTGLRLGMGREEIAFVIGPLLVFVGAQAIADHGKERAMVEAVSKEREREFILDVKDSEKKRP